MGRLAVVGTGSDVAVGAIAVAIFLPLHAQHLCYGLRGARPPRAGLTLGAMVVVHAVALVVIGPTWSFMLATLATSGLIVLRRPWSFALLVACSAAPFAVPADPGTTLFGTTEYLAYSVFFRSLIQFALVWLVAATHQLAAARGALAVELVVKERARLKGEVRAAVERRLELLVAAARRLPQRSRPPRGGRLRLFRRSVPPAVRGGTLGR